MCSAHETGQISSERRGQWASIIFQHNEPQEIHVALDKVPPLGMRSCAIMITPVYWGTIAK